MVRFALAATLSSNYGIYGPAFELMVQEALPGTEEYLDSEKYERKRWNRNDPKSLAGFITQINQIRRENAALQMTANLQFLPVDNENMLCYGKFCENPSNNLLIVVNLDAFNLQEGTLTIPLGDLHTAKGLIGTSFERSSCFWEGRESAKDPVPMICL